MKKSEFGELMRRVFDTEIDALRDAGQKEYAGGDDSDSFTNFNKLSADLGIDRKQVLWVYAMKHRDGIASYLRGHVSQRESVEGRINDLIVYLFLLRGMIEEENAVIEQQSLLDNLTIELERRGVISDQSQGS